MPQSAENQTVNFIVIAERGSLGNAPNTCYLWVNNWDDFGFKTTFALYYITKDGEQKDLGRISIANEGLTGGYVQLPESPFIQLPENYCSLGHSQGYYEELMGLPSLIRISILRGLRDCAYDQEIFERFQDENAVSTSLLRHVSVQNVNYLFPNILRGHAVATPYKFQFRLNGNETTAIDVSVVPDSTPPTNIHVLIGRNGVGKTRILSGLADQITKNPSPADISQNGEIVFSQNTLGFLEQNGQSDRFTNLVTVVFSAFDHFKPIRNNQDRDSIPCQYIGLKSEDGSSFRTPSDLKQDFNKSVEICLNSQRKSRWIDAIRILCSDPIFKEYELENTALDAEHVAKITGIFDKLSSGHKIILLTVTKLVELVDEKTLVLIDEPENHLHPPLLSSFIRTVSDLLIKRNAVAIVATHSPVVLQEVPQSCVTKIDRVRSEYSLYRPDIETYGENVGTLTREVFQLEVMDSGFHKTISDHLNSDKNYDNLLNSFGGKIGSEGKAIARSIILTSGDSNA
ncbi:MAG: AAA family ATPase [Proteobacteria bacterium]|nr:AAA family ATPase [Pseudomonadota bacterium]MDA0967363.1 AAA family ATPase [Pseudomonadota bacterium]